jgi:hypothetical protein
VQSIARPTLVAVTLDRLKAFTRTMSTEFNLIRLVKELKGAPLSTLVLLYLSPVPATQHWIEIHSGYSPKPVKTALCYLRECDLVIKTSRGWVLSQSARQSLPVLDCVSSDHNLDPGDDPKSGLFCHSPINIINKVKDKDSRTHNINKQTGKKCQSKNPTGAEINPADYPDIVQAFHDCGIHLNNRTRQLLPAITARDVRTAYTRLYNQGKQNETGILVTILEEIAAKKQRSAYHQQQLYADWEVD